MTGSNFRFACWFLGAGMAFAQAPLSVSFVYTQAPRYQAGAAGERFPLGAALQLVADGHPRPLVPEFAASADASVSFDGRRVLFAGKQKPGDPWQIWEVDLAGGAPRRVTPYREDAVAPLYLAGSRIAYAVRTAAGWQVETVPLAGGERIRLTYAPGDYLPTDALRDGRVLFDGPYRGASAPARDVYAVYVDGTGVESVRCDHGRDRHAGRQLASGDIVFETGGRLARFTSARAVEVEIPLPAGEFAGPVAEIAEADWLVAWRPAAGGAFGIYRWNGGPGRPKKLIVPAGASAVQPVMVRPHPVPKRHPSGLGNREGANLLCLNVYTARRQITAGAVATVRVWALDDLGAPVNLGQAPVASDGSFFVQAPAERAVRFELLDRAGNSVAAEKGWFWARRGEQRVCVGCHAGPERAPENAVPQILLRSTVPAPMLFPQKHESAEAHPK